MAVEKYRQRVSALSPPGCIPRGKGLLCCPLWYDALAQTAYLAAVSGSEYNPELLLLSVAQNGSAGIVQRYALQAGTPVHIDRIPSSENTLQLVITHHTALTFAAFDRGAITVGNRILPLKSALDCSGILSLYNKDIDASIVVCRKRNGIAVIDSNVISPQKNLSLRQANTSMSFPQVKRVGNPSGYRRMVTKTGEGFRTSRNDSTVNHSGVCLPKQ